MPEKDAHKLPRLYVGGALAQGLHIDLEAAQAHYLRNVLRRQEGDFVRVFNGSDGEWLARIFSLGKKKGEAVAEKCLRKQPGVDEGSEVHLYFTPIKKQRMDMLIEKAVELGVRELHPVITRRTEIRKVNEERVRVQVTEAAEQCERMDIPVLHSVRRLEEILSGLDVPLYACIERDPEAQALGERELGKKTAFLIGPEGGFEENEIAELLACENVTAVSLGESILRAETAALACLSWARLRAGNGNSL